MEIARDRNEEDLKEQEYYSEPKNDLKEQVECYPEIEFEQSLSNSETPDIKNEEGLEEEQLGNYSEIEFEQFLLETGLYDTENEDIGDQIETYSEIEFLLKVTKEVI